MPTTPPKLEIPSKPRALDSFACFNTLSVGDQTVGYYDLRADKLAALADIERLPKSIKVLLENILRHEDGETCQRADIIALAQSGTRPATQEIAYHPVRVLMQDFTGVPAVVDLAAMRAALIEAGMDGQKINPLAAVDLIIDHSVVIDQFATHTAFATNVDLEMQRNAERYAFLKWGQNAFDNFRLAPPGTGICHQVNLEYIAKGVWSEKTADGLLAYPDTLVGTDSHTTMINGLGVLGWGVGGIEAEAAMLGQPIPMLIPEVVGFELCGQLCDGITATDLVLRIVEMLRAHGVVGKFVEFYGEALDHLPLAERATIANMAPEYGATCGFFPVDQQTIDYLQLSGRPAATIALVEAYAKAQGLWRVADALPPHFSSTVQLDISTVQTNLSGPKRPQDRVVLADLPAAMNEFIQQDDPTNIPTVPVDSGDGFTMQHGDVVVAAITSCTNTSNPAVMIAAGLVAKKAVERGLSRKPWVKSSLAPGSKVVTEYLVKAGLQTYLDQLGFHTVGYGCTTCIGNSGPLPAAVHATVKKHDLVVASVLSGNRNFEGRIHPLVKANWLASPPLVVAYAIAGSTCLNITTEPLAENEQGEAVFLRDLWPSNAEIAASMKHLERSMFTTKYADVFTGDAAWLAVPTASGDNFAFDADSTYIQRPPFFSARFTAKRSNIKGARVLMRLGDSVTTDHISPASTIAADSPAAEYLTAHGVPPNEFNSYGSRRGNHEVMMRGTFANIRIRNELVPGTEGGYTCTPDDPTPIPVFDAAMQYQAADTPTVIVAGREYGTGSSRDWAAKGPLLLGVKAVIVESFERIHRANLVGMGILPLQFLPGENRNSLQLGLTDQIDILGLDEPLTPKQRFGARIHRTDGSVDTIELQSRIDTAVEVQYYLSGGVLPYVLNKIKSAS